MLGICACNGSETGPLYQIEDIVKENLMWDTNALYNVIPETRAMDDIVLADNIEAFKFKSVGYQEKDNTWVFGAIGTPSTPMPKNGYPAVVLIHGGGGYVFSSWMAYWMDRGYVAIAIDMWGNELNYALQKVTNPEGGPREHDGPNYDSTDDVTQSWVYHSVHNIIMANNLLRARDDVDNTRIVATGISWGGFITNIVSGVDKRFAAFAPVYGSGYIYDDSFWTNGHGTFGGDDKEDWIAKYDASSYLPYATKPMLFVSGINDGCFSLVNRMKSAALVKGKVFYSQRSDLTHGNFWMMTPEIYAFFEHVLYGKNTITKIENAYEENGVITLKTSNDLFHTVKLLYTVSKDQDSHKWEWRSITLTKEKGVFSYTLPADATAYTFELIGDSNDKDKDGFFRQSTQVFFVKN